REQLAGGPQSWQHLALEILALPQVERADVEHEKAAVDPVVGKDRLLSEPPDVTVLRQIDRPVLRRERDRRQGRGGSMVAMEREQRAEIHVAQTVGVGGE